MLVFISFTSTSAFAPKVSCLSTKEQSTNLDTFCRTKNRKLHLCRSPRLLSSGTGQPPWCTYQQPVLQGNNISKTFILRSLLRKRGVDLAGISVRPVMPQADLTAEVLGSKTPHVSVQGLWALPHIPNKVPALIDIPLIQGNTPDTCTSMKNRFKRHFRTSRISVVMGG